MPPIAKPPVRPPARKATPPPPVQELPPVQEAEDLDAWGDSFTQILAQCKADFDPEQVRQRPGPFNKQTGQRVMLDYVEWSTVAERLDEVYPRWKQSILSLEFHGILAICRVSIEIDGVTREGLGTGVADFTKTDLSELQLAQMGIKKAEHDALKRAAIKFGIARSLYGTETKHEESSDAGSNGGYDKDDPNVGFPQDATGGRKASDKQIAFARSIAEKAGIDLDNTVRHWLQAEVNDLNITAGSKLIQYLKGWTNQEPFRAWMNDTVPCMTDGQWASPQPIVESPTASIPAPARPQASTLAYTGGNGGQAPANGAANDGSITAKQIGFIKMLCRNAGLDADAECFEVMKTDIPNLSKFNAGKFIEYLQAMEGGNAPAPVSVATLPPPPPPAPPMQRAINTAPPPPRASAAQGRMINMGQIKAIQHYCHMTGMEEVATALEYTMGRTDDISKMSEAEASIAIEALNSMPAR